MDRGLWPIVIVVGCLVAAGFFMWWLQPKEPNLRADSVDQIVVAYYATHPECQLKALGALPRNQRERQARSCADGVERHREAAGSLVEAQRQADAANAGVMLAKQQTRTAAFGFGIGSLTLFAAAAAAWYAKQAAESAMRALQHEKDVAGIQLRPNVHIESVDVMGENTATPKVTVLVRNSGTVPAREFRATGGWEFRESEAPARLSLSRITVPKQLTFGTAITLPIEPSDPLSLTREGVLHCEFELSWEDRAGARHRISEVHRFDGEEFRFLDDTSGL